MIKLWNRCSALRWLPIFWILIAGLNCPASDAGVPDVEEILQRFLGTARSAAEREASQELVYVRRSVFEHLRSDGSVEERRSKEHCVTNCAGIVRAILIRFNDRDPTPDEVLSDQQKESEGRREFSRRRQGPDFLDANLIGCFRFLLKATEEVDGRPTYRLAFEARDASELAARPEVSGNRDINRVIALLHGQMWIDCETFELVRLDCSLRSPFRLLGGIVASLNRFDLSVIRRQVTPDCWSNVRFSSRIEGRKLVSPMRIRLQIEQEGFTARPIDPSPTQ
jgi:hypothetical protein